MDVDPATASAFAPLLYRAPGTLSASERATVHVLVSLSSIDPSGRGLGVARARLWCEKYAAVVATAAVSSPLPSDLQSWVKNQRRNRNLSELQMLLLEEIPRWSWNPRNDRWERRAHEVFSHQRRFGQRPRARSSDPSERALGIWLGRQRRLADEGRIPYERITTLRQILTAEQ